MLWIAPAAACVSAAPVPDYEGSSNPGDHVSPRYSQTVLRSLLCTTLQPVTARLPCYPALIVPPAPHIPAPYRVTSSLQHNHRWSELIVASLRLSLQSSHRYYPSPVSCTSRFFVTAWPRSHGSIFKF